MNRFIVAMFAMLSSAAAFAQSTEAPKVVAPEKLDEAARARLDQEPGVLRLLAVAVRQRDEHARQAGDGGLRMGVVGRIVHMAVHVYIAEGYPDFADRDVCRLCHVVS